MKSDDLIRQVFNINILRIYLTIALHFAKVISSTGAYMQHLNSLFSFARYSVKIVQSFITFSHFNILPDRSTLYYHQCVIM